MNTANVLHHGHSRLIAVLHDVPPALWEEAGACGVWSIKEILAHLTSYEQVLVEVFTAFLRTEPSPMLNRWLTDAETFNQVEVAQRHMRPISAILAEYKEAHTETSRLLECIPLEMRMQNGTLPWYGSEYDLDDFIVYTYYGHKQEHAAQIVAFQERVRLEKS